MGQAKKRQQALLAKINALNADEQNVVRVAQVVLTKLNPYAGACYRCAFFLRLFLKEEFGIEGKAIVGFANDGTDDLYGSHAWYEFNGKVTDIAISRPQFPDIQKPGPVIIQGVEFKPGHTWTYHQSRPPEGLQALSRLLSAGDQAVFQSLTQDEELHRGQIVRSNDDDLMRAFLDAAPDGATYEHWATLVRSARC